MEDDLLGYWEAKNFGTMSVEVGFKVYEAPDKTEPYIHGHTTYEYTLFDHGFIDHTPEPEEPADDEEAGAMALVSVAATALAAFLVF